MSDKEILESLRANRTRCVVYTRVMGEASAFRGRRLLVVRA